MYWALGTVIVGLVAVIGSILAMTILPDVGDEEDPNYISDRSCFFMITCLIGCVLMVVGLIAAGIIWLVGLIL